MSEKKRTEVGTGWKGAWGDEEGAREEKMKKKKKKKKKKKRKKNYTSVSFAWRVESLPSRRRSQLSHQRDLRQ